MEITRELPGASLSKTSIRQPRPVAPRAGTPARAGRTTRPLGDVSVHRGRDALKRSIDRADSHHAILLREVHHRVKNNLQVMQSLLNLEASRTSNADVTRIVRVLQDRLRAVALVHDQLHRSPALTRVNLRSYAAAVLDGIEQSHGLASRGIVLRLGASQGAVSMNDALRVGLILNELVSNAVSHGFPDGRSGRIAVSLSLRNTAHVRLRVTNSGLPLPLHFDPPPDRLGLAIVSNIARHSGGRFWWSQRGQASFHVELKPS